MGPLCTSGEVATKILSLTNFKIGTPDRLTWATLQVRIFSSEEVYWLLHKQLQFICCYKPIYEWSKRQYLALTLETQTSFQINYFHLETLK